MISPCTNYAYLVSIEKTALAGKVKTEVCCLPVENDDFRQVMGERNIKESKPLRETLLISGHGTSSANNVFDPAISPSTGSLSNFIVSQYAVQNNFAF